MTTRMSAEQRRELAVRAAVTEFARGGYEGTSTAAIANRIGVSQPYLFRLFPTKRALFLAAVEHCYDEITEALVGSAAGLTGPEAVSAMGDRYRALLTDSTLLQFQLQTYTAALDDPEIREAGRRRMAGIFRDVSLATGEEPTEVMRFVAIGMLLNVLTALGVPYSSDRAEFPESLARWAATAP